MQRERYGKEQVLPVSHIKNQLTRRRETCPIIPLTILVVGALPLQDCHYKVHCHCRVHCHYNCSFFLPCRWKAKITSFAEFSLPENLDGSHLRYLGPGAQGFNDRSVENYFAQTEPHPVEPLRHTKDLISKRISQNLSLSISNPTTYDCFPLLTCHAPPRYVP